MHIKFQISTLKFYSIALFFLIGGGAFITPGLGKPKKIVDLEVKVVPKNKTPTGLLPHPQIYRFYSSPQQQSSAKPEPSTKITLEMPRFSHEEELERCLTDTCRYKKMVDKALRPNTFDPASFFRQSPKIRFEVIY